MQSTETSEKPAAVFSPNEDEVSVVAYVGSVKKTYFSSHCAGGSTFTNSSSPSWHALTAGGEARSAARAGPRGEQSVAAGHVLSRGRRDVDRPGWRR